MTLRISGGNARNGVVNCSQAERHNRMIAGYLSPQAASKSANRASVDGGEMVVDGVGGQLQIARRLDLVYHPVLGGGPVRDDACMPVSPSSEPADARDREAVEYVLGRSLSGPWPAAAALAPGSRVRVIRDPEWDGPWQNEFAGTIDVMGPPEPVQNPPALPGELKYWVTFDAPQYDSAGDGPYRKAQIWGRYLVSEDGPESEAGAS